MPLYEFYCVPCDFRFELLRPLSMAGEEASCPRCHVPARRVLSTFAAFSKGSEGASTPVAGSSPCASCSATSCGTCDL